MSEEKMKHIKALAREILVLCEDIPESVRKEKPEISPKKQAPVTTGTDFTTIHAKSKDYDLLNVDVHKVSEPTSGVNKTTNKEWSRQSIDISDQEGQHRELVAWGDLTEKLSKIRVGDRLNVTNVKEVRVYKEKLQFTIGSNTEIEIQAYSGGQHRL